MLKVVEPAIHAGAINHFSRTIHTSKSQDPKHTRIQRGSYLVCFEHHLLVFCSRFPDASPCNVNRGLEVTKLSTNKQHLSLPVNLKQSACTSSTSTSQKWKNHQQEQATGNKRCEHTRFDTYMTERHLASSSERSSRSCSVTRFKACLSSSSASENCGCLGTVTSFCCFDLLAGSSSCLADSSFCPFLARGCD